MKPTWLHEGVQRALHSTGAISAGCTFTYTGRSLCAIAAFGVVPAFAQGIDESQRLETITVTGTNIRRVDVETANPVITIDRAAIQKSGKLNIGDVIQDLPSIAGNADNPRVNAGGAGTAGVSLRGLGSNRTLILVNGHRLLNGDVTTLPTTMIERVEVLGDGASATYGSDAIGGVVNFILRSDYQGAEFNMDYGISDRDDGERKGYSVTIGQATDKGSVMAGAKYERFKAIPAPNRKFSAFAYYLRYGVASAPGGSARNPRSQVSLPDDLAAELGLGCDAVSLDPNVTGRATRANYHCYDGNSVTGDAFNFQSIGNYDLIAQERTSLFVIGNYKLGENVTAYIEAFHNKSSSNTQGAPLPFDALNDGVVISGRNYYNPFGVDFGGSATDNPEFLTRWAAAGPRKTAREYTTDQIDTGFKGQIGDSSWQWSANFNYGHTNAFFQSSGYLYYNGMKDALGPSFYDPGTGTVVCGTPDAPIANCTPINIFNQNDPNTTAALKPFLASPFGATTFISREGSVNANGELATLPAGVINLAVGASARKQYQRVATDYIALTTGDNGTCFISQEACATPLSGGFTVKEAYAEMLIPILKDVPFAHALNVTLGDRYSKYSSAGNTNNWKVAIEWRPIEDLLLRGTVSKVFRAPTIADLYSGTNGSAPPFTDPCEAEGAGPSRNPACHGVVDGHVPGADFGQVNSVRSGAVFAGYDLQPEFGKSFDFGVVYDPQWFQGLSLGADLWRIYLNNVITAISAQTIGDLCYASTEANPSAFCPFIHRASNGRVLLVNEPTVNLGRLDTRGVDFNASYRLPQTAFGTFRLGFQSTYVAQYKDWLNFGVDGPAQVVNVAGHFSNQFGNYARWRALANVEWTLGAIDAGLQARYIGPIHVGWADGSGPSADQGLPNIERTFASMTYLSAHVGYDIEPIDTRIDLGIDNLADRQPPRLYQNNATNANTDVNTYDTVGRYYWARVTVKF